MSRSQWTNIAFVLCACLGALFSAAYFFNGAELLRTSATWPREFLYPRSSALAAFEAQAKNKNFNADNATRSDAFIRSGDPFSRATTPFRLNSASSITPGPNPTSLLRQLDLPPRGGDELSRALNNSAADLSRSATDARGAVAPAQTVRSTSQSGIAGMKNVTSRAKSASSSASRSTVRNARQQSALRAAKFTNQHSLKNATQRGANAVAKTPVLRQTSNKVKTNASPVPKPLPRASAGATSLQKVSSGKSGNQAAPGPNPSATAGQQLGSLHRMNGSASPPTLLGPHGGR